MLSGNDHASSIMIKMKSIIIVVSFNMLFEEKILITKSTKRANTRDINMECIIIIIENSLYSLPMKLGQEWYTQK